MSILRVAFDLTLPRLFDYSCADATVADIGVRVLVPFGNKQAVGMIVGIADSSEIESGKLKSALRILRETKRRIVLYCDDLSFDKDDTSYKSLKAALEGGIEGRPVNTIFYATSNRRHLIPEYESDTRGAMRVNGEIHHGEAVEEKMSLSGRFGLWVAFHPFSQALYVDVARRWVGKLAAQAGAWGVARSAGI